MREVCGGASGRGLQPGHAVHIVRCGALLGCGRHVVYTVCCGDERCRQQCIDAVRAFLIAHGAEPVPATPNSDFISASVTIATAEQPAPSGQSKPASST